MTRAAFGPALMLAIGACAPTTHATTFISAPPKQSGQEVEVFTEPQPTRPYRQLGMIEVKAVELGADDYGDLIQLARAGAARMGGDAIMVTRNPETRTMGAVYSTRTIEVPRIQVAVIAWKADS